MSDPYRDPARAPYVQETNKTPWIAGGIAVALLLAFGLWAMDHRTPTTAAVPPVVTAAPAPATGVPGPAPQETTGQTAPRAQ
jgi:hypothetical protein